MKGVRRWLLASPGKVPHYIDGTNRRGALDTPEDLARLATHNEAKMALLQCGPGWRLGFALGPDGEGGHWQGVDFDAIEDNLLAVLVDALPGYVETSPSDQGVHAIGYGRHFRTLGSNGSGIEAYAAGRFFTFTGNKIRDGGVVCLADHVEKELARHHHALSTKALSDRVSNANKTGAIVQVSAQTVADLRSALNHMRSDDYALWIEIGHALKPLGDTGRGLWLDWSGTSSKFDPGEAARKWESFAPTGTGYRSVFAKAQTLGWINPASNVAGNLAVEAVPSEQCIAAVPYVLPESFEIPPRPWLLGYWLMRGTVTTLIAPGGTGKSSFMVATALSLASGLDFLGKTVWGGPQRVWLWNLEDDRDELDRQIYSCFLHHNVAGGFTDRLFVNDAGSNLCTATKSREGFVIHEPVNAALVAEIRARRIDVLIVDPFVSSHRAEENDNGQIDAIAKRWASVAREANCSIVLVHHSRKQGGQQVDAEAARGASALGNAARTVLVLNRMEKSEAARLGIADDDRRSYIRVGNDKANRAPAGKGDWYRLVSVDLANGGPAGGDSVAVIERWVPPELTVNFGDDVRAIILAEIASGEWRANITARAWAGIAIAMVIGADLDDPGDKRRVKALLGDMLSKGQLRTEQRKDANRHMRDFIVVGEQVGELCDTSEW
ncbi:MAG: AAA family ATPase [Sphingomonadaceae bacterium]|nr:AAA family ATPase [Sphingomonadaceae bacterium]